METGVDTTSAFIDLINTKPLWFPEKVKVDKSRSTNKLIYCVIDEYDPISKSALDSFKKKIIEKGKEYFDNVSIVDNDDGFSILIK